MINQLVAQPARPASRTTRNLWLRQKKLNNFVWKCFATEMIYFKRTTGDQKYLVTHFEYKIKITLGKNK
jgi:hypothetical protein